MEFFRIKKDIPFMRYALVLNAVSFITFALAVFFLVTRGLHLSVEFTGGTVMEVAYTQTADVPRVRETVAALGYADVVVQNLAPGAAARLGLEARQAGQHEQGGQRGEDLHGDILMGEIGGPESVESA